MKREFNAKRERKDDVRYPSFCVLPNGEVVMRESKSLILTPTELEHLKGDRLK